ncbi:peptide/nickel transport system permease protein [Pseudonocardia sediminis]|uniref:Peptide/nickel transport system permease protein n=1 Tax=Pseudonocardia sediminis TaxID=1397368 RepID=A0A4Q7V2X6_PSEST|nr:ABC transporter permease subunit [Pseudonocardia sediminis]RZT87771.1 peptide/nickel transport system permease protein [Pseudonocardia sediminis]
MTTAVAPSRASTVVLVVAVVLTGVPLLAALAGPALVAVLGIAAPPGASALLPPGDGGMLGTDALGRDVLALALTGGTSVVLLTAGALAVAYAVGTPLGLALAATTRRRAAAAVLRVLDVLLVLPSLLILLVLAATDRRGVVWLLLAAAVVQLPAVVRLVRSAASAPARRVALETMTMNGEPWWRVHLLETARFVTGPVLVDAGTRFVLVLTLLAGANFLGIGLGPDSSDWAVVIEQNTSSLFLAPATLLVPAGLLVSLAAGVNLLVDQLCDRTGATA